MSGSPTGERFATWRRSEERMDGPNRRFVQLPSGAFRRDQRDRPPCSGDSATLEFEGANLLVAPVSPERCAIFSCMPRHAISAWRSLEETGCVPLLGRMIRLSPSDLSIDRSSPSVSDRAEGFTTIDGRRHRA
jgi:hypothetical protein